MRDQAVESTARCMRETDDSGFFSTYLWGRIMQKTTTKGRATIDLESLVAILNPAIFIVLLGGLLLKFDTVTLIIVGVVGYTIWGILNLLVKRERQREFLLQQEKKKRKGQVKAPKLIDLGFVASLLNPVVLIILFVGIMQGWDISVLVTIGVIGYGSWMVLTMKDRRQKQTNTKKRKK